MSSCGDDVCEAAYEYGRHTGLAFQLTDDMLDYGGSSKEFGKPTAIDLKLGLATAPVLYAADEVDVAMDTACCNHRYCVLLCIPHVFTIDTVCCY